MALHAGKKKVRILIADDSAIIRERLVVMLKELEGVAIVAQTGDILETLQAVCLHKPDIVIMDIRMQAGNAIEAVQFIKRTKPAMVVIILTNYPYPVYREKFQQAGADYFFDKSKEFEQIPGVIKSLQQDTNTS